MSCLFHFISNSSKGPQKEKPPRLPAPVTPVKVKPTFCIYDSDDSDETLSPTNSSSSNNNNNYKYQTEFPQREISPCLLYQDCCLSDTFFVLLDCGELQQQQGERMKEGERSEAVRLPYVPRVQSRYPAVRWEWECYPQQHHPTTKLTNLTTG